MGNNHTKMLKKFYELSNAGYFTILVFLIKLFGQKLKFALFITIDLLVVRIITFDFLDARPIFICRAQPTAYLVVNILLLLQRSSTLF